jgi:CMP-N-acetylneuraminic acid synthetase
MKICAVIPARGGSKSIPKKNITPFGGKPLIAYSIVQSLRSKHIDRTIVSTDDDEIASVARDWGAEVPFMRPAEFAQDKSTDLPVFVHALDWLRDNDGYIPDIVVHLRPTSPIRTPDLIDSAIETLINEPEADSVKTVCDPGQSPYRMWRIAGKYVEPFMDRKYYDPSPAPRQDLPVVYWQTSSIDVIRYATIMEKKSMIGDRVLPLDTPEKIYTIDIDSAFDIWLAETALEFFNAKD